MVVEAAAICEWGLLRKSATVLGCQGRICETGTLHQPRACASGRLQARTLRSARKHGGVDRTFVGQHSVSFVGSSQGGQLLSHLPIHSLSRAVQFAKRPALASRFCSQVFTTCEEGSTKCSASQSPGSTRPYANDKLDADLLAPDSAAVFESGKDDLKTVCPSRKHSILYSVAAIPSLATVFYAPLASNDLAVHLELRLPDLAVAVLTAAAALVWVQFFDELAKRNVFERKLSRKLVHISSGLLFMLFWPVFSSNPSSRWYAALVPAANLLRLTLVGTGLVKNENTVKAISREGDKRELLGGPLYYVIVLIAATVGFWRQSPIGVSALSLMCAGDGIADIVGRRFGNSMKLPYNKSKSWAGSAAMFLTGTATAVLYVTYFCNFGFYECNMMQTAVKLAAIAFAATVVESLPITDRLDDNVTVPLTCVAVGSLLFPS